MNARHAWPRAGLKLCAAPGIELPKANYRLGWSVTEQRLAEGKDAKRLCADHPGVYQTLLQVCARLIDPDSIPKPANTPGIAEADLQGLRVDLCSVIAKLDFIIQEVLQ